MGQPAVKDRLRSRHDERFQLRLKKEIDEVYGKMVERFTDAVVTAEDPEGYEIKRLARQLDAQWRLLCQRKNLVAAIYPAMRTYTDRTLADYLTLLDGDKRHTPPVDAQAPGEEVQGPLLQHEEAPKPSGTVVVDGATGDVTADSREVVQQSGMSGMLEGGEDRADESA